MKKNKLLMTIPVILLLSACSNNGHINNINNPVQSLLNSALSSSDEVVDTSSSNIVISSVSSSKNNDYPTYDKIDVDLTTMNANMVYSEVYNMIYYPSSYKGKIVKVEGPFRPYESTNPDYCYPAILVQDAAACCGNGLEFLLYGVPRCKMQGGNGYPVYNEQATIVGRFETYVEGTYVFVHLVDAIWIK